MKPIAPPRRLVRFFEVSATKRAVGAMWVAEVGGGCSFRQSDLQPHECYVLDAGGAAIYTWCGPHASAPAHEALLEVASKYAASLGTDATLRCHLRGFLPSDTLERDIEVREAVPGAEPLEFQGCFCAWHKELAVQSEPISRVTVSTPGPPAGAPAAGPASARRPS